MEKLLRRQWPGNLRELSHTVRTMTLFCNGSVILPVHVLFLPDLESHSAGWDNVQTGPMPVHNHTEPERHIDLFLDSGIKRHVRLVYDQANRRQRQAADLLGIYRSL